MLLQLVGAQSTPPRLQAANAASIGPSVKQTVPRHTTSIPRVIVAIQRLPLVSVGPWYLTTAQALEPETWVPVHENSCGCFIGSDQIKRCQWFGLSESYSRTAQKARLSTKEDGSAPGHG
jgi:hypothetical protein